MFKRFAIAGIVAAGLLGLGASARADQPSQGQEPSPTCPAADASVRHPGDADYVPPGTEFQLGGNPIAKGQATLIEPGTYYDSSQIGVKIVHGQDQVPTKAIPFQCP